MNNPTPAFVLRREFRVRRYSVKTGSHPDSFYCGRENSWQLDVRIHNGWDRRLRIQIVDGVFFLVRF